MYLHVACQVLALLAFTGEPGSPAVGSGTSSLPTLGATMTPGMARSAPRPPAVDGRPDLHRGGNYVHLSPGIVGFTGIADANAVAYPWGLAGGRYFTAGKRFAGAAGGFGEHLMIWYFPGEAPAVGGPGPPQHELRLGAELRLGLRGRRFFAYGLGRIGTALSLDYHYIEDNYDGTPPVEYRYKVYPWVMGSAGVGVQGLLGRRWLLGGEQFIDIGGDAFFLVRFRLLVGVKF